LYGRHDRRGRYFRAEVFENLSLGINEKLGKVPWDGKHMPATLAWFHMVAQKMVHGMSMLPIDVCLLQNGEVDAERLELLLHKRANLFGRARLLTTKLVARKS